MNILVDENIPYGVEAFGTLGAVRRAPGRAITKDMLEDVTALIVRSITRVDESLLTGTPVRFVGTCTIGEDHIDKAYLAAQRSGFSSAPGCNANSVAEYIVTAILALAQKHHFNPADLKLGIVGVGNVGTKVWQKATALGMQCVLNDPPLQAASQDPVYRPLTEIQECPIITFHVPLNKGGAYPTRHLADERFLAALRPGTIIFNTSRGAVVDNQALKGALRNRHIAAAVLDVWEHEPTPDLELLRLTDIATPHIAGYSFDGKVNGTRQIYDALCTFLGLPISWDPRPFLPAPPLPELHIDTEDPEILVKTVLKAYDLAGDDERMRKIFVEGQGQEGLFFDGLRKEYPVRREFFNTTLHLKEEENPLKAVFSGIGFTVL